MLPSHASSIDLPGDFARRQPPTRPSPVGMSMGETDTAGNETVPAAPHGDLLAAVARGDHYALGRLYDALARPLYALACRILGDAAEAQDVVHDVFFAIWNKADRYDAARGTVFSWAATLTRHRAIDRLRLRQRRADLLDGAADLPHAPIPSAAGDFFDDLWLRERTAAVRSALAELEPGHQVVIELAYFGGLTHQEIADRLRQPLGTVKARIRRGLLKLRHHLSARP